MYPALPNLHLSHVLTACQIQGSRPSHNLSNLNNEYTQKKLFWFRDSPFEVMLDLIVERLTVKLVIKCC